jgi:hypothetical protein
MSYLAHARAVILRRSSERSERSEVSHASGDAREQLETQTLDSSLSSLNSLLQTPTESPAAANDTLEPAALTLDGEGLPAAPYPSCGGVAFHQAPGAPWRCSVCEPPRRAALGGVAVLCFAPGCGRSHRDRSHPGAALGGGAPLLAR